MLSIRGLCTASFLFLIASFSQLYAEEVIWQKMRQLIDQGKPQLAYEMGEAALSRYEGSPDFDYYYGIAAIDSGDISKGVFALERVLYLKPNFYAAELELARGYYLLGQYAQAKKHFTRVLSLTPPQAVQQQIQLFLTIINERTRQQKPNWLAYVEGVIGRDSNISQAPNNDTFYSPILGEGVLSDTAQKKSDTFYDIRFGAAYYVPVNPQASYYLRFDGVDHNIADNEQFESQSKTLQLGTLQQLGNGVSMNAQFIHQQYELDGENYRELNGVAGAVSKNIDTTSSYNVGFSLLDFRYHELASKNAFESNLNLGYDHQISYPYEALLSANLHIGHDKARENTTGAEAQTERNFWGAGFSQRLLLRDDLAFTTKLNYLHSRYGGEDLLFLKTREDNSYHLVMQLDWRLNVHWRLRTEVGYSRQDSNIELYDFDRSYAQFGVRYEYF